MSASKDTLPFGGMKSNEVNAGTTSRDILGTTSTHMLGTTRRMIHPTEIN